MNFTYYYQKQKIRRQMPPDSTKFIYEETMSFDVLLEQSNPEPHFTRLVGFEIV